MLKLNEKKGTSNPQLTFINVLYDLLEVPYSPYNRIIQSTER